MIGAGAGVLVLVAVLILSGCEQVMPPESAPPPPTPDPPKVTVSDDVSVINDSDIGTVDDDSVSFAQPVSYSTGDVIVAGVTARTPAGMLRRVTAVSADGRTVTTEQATLEDVVQEGTLVVSGELRETDLTPDSRKAVADAGIILRAGHGLQPASSGGFEFGYDLPNVEFRHGSRSLYMEGSIGFSLEYDLEIDYRDGVVHSARFTIEPRQTVNLRLSAEVSVPKQILSGLEFSLFPTPLIFLPVTVLVGPVPVVITPSFQLYAGVDATGHITVDVVQEGSVQIGVECAASCHRTTSWKPIVDPSVAFRVNEAAVGADVRGYVRPELKVKLYDVIGPTAGVEVYAAVGGRGGARSNGLFAVAYLEAGVSAYAGVTVDVPIIGTSLLQVRVLDGIDVIGPIRLWEWPAVLLAGRYDYYEGDSYVSTWELKADGTVSGVDLVPGSVVPVFDDFKIFWSFYPERRVLTFGPTQLGDERLSRLGSTSVIPEGWNTGDELCIDESVSISISEPAQPEEPVQPRPTTVELPPAQLRILPTRSSDGSTTSTEFCYHKLIPERTDSGVVLGTPSLQHDDTPALMAGTYRIRTPSSDGARIRLNSDGTGSPVDSDDDLAWWYHEERRLLTLVHRPGAHDQFLQSVYLPEGWDGEAILVVCHDWFDTGASRPLDNKDSCIYLERISP